MAEGILKDLLQRDGQEQTLQVRSAGTWTHDGLSASRLALEAMQELGLDIAGHRSRHLTSDDVEEASLIIVMTQDQKEALAAEFPEARGRLHLLSEIAGKKRQDIDDPSGSDSLQLHRTCAQEIRELLVEGYSRILELATSEVGET